MTLESERMSAMSSWLKATVSGISNISEAASVLSVDHLYGMHCSYTFASHTHSLCPLSCPGGFCESVLHLTNRTGPWPNEPAFIGTRPGRPEAGSMASAIFIAFLGIYQIAMFRQPEPSLRYISVLITVNGFSSFENHRAHHIIADFWDGASMIIAVNFTAAIVLETMVDLKFRRPGRCRVGVADTCHQFRQFRLPFVGALWLALAGLITCLGLMSVNPFSGLLNLGGFVLLFNMPILLMVIIIVYLQTPSGVLLLIGQGDAKARDLNRVHTYTAVGVFSYLTGWVLWNIVDGEWVGCADVPDSLIAVAHPIWHLTAAYGLHCLLAIVVYFRGQTALGRTTRWTSGQSRPARVWFIFFPTPIVEEREGLTGRQESHFAGNGNGDIEVGDEDAEAQWLAAGTRGDAGLCNGPSGGAAD